MAESTSESQTLLLGTAASADGMCRVNGASKAAVAAMLRKVRLTIGPPLCLERPALTHCDGFSPQRSRISGEPTPRRANRFPRGCLGRPVKQGVGWHVGNL